MGEKFNSNGSRGSLDAKPLVPKERYADYLKLKRQPDKREYQKPYIKDPLVRSGLRNKTRFSISGLVRSSSSIITGRIRSGSVLDLKIFH